MDSGNLKRISIYPYFVFDCIIDKLVLIPKPVTGRRSAMPDIERNHTMAIKDSVAEMVSKVVMYG
jgi:hypothetical protein